MGYIALVVKPSPTSYTWPSKLSSAPSSSKSADKVDRKIRSLPITSSFEGQSKTSGVEKTKQSCIFTRAPLLISPSSPTPNMETPRFSSSTTKLYQFQTRLGHLKPLFARAKGFGSSQRKNRKNKKPENEFYEDEDDDDDEIEEMDRRDGVIPEIVTNRMISRMGFSVGIPLFMGLLFFPFFYYLKVGLKIDVPTWVPFIVSFIFFGSALLGISYGIVSTSWDPMREGSLLGWNEARKNWPVFWQSFRGGRSERN